MIYLETKNHTVLYSGDFSTRTMFGINGMKIREDIRPQVLLLNAPNIYQDKSEWDCYFSKAEAVSGDNYHYQKLQSFIRNCLDKSNNVYIYSRSIPRHLDLMYFLQNSFADIPVLLEAKSRMVVDGLADMGYHIFSENMVSEETNLSTPYIVVGQETGKKNCISVSFDSYSLHASPVETVELLEKIGAKHNFLLHVKPDSRKKSPIEYLERRNDISVVQAVNGMKYYLERRKRGDIKCIDISVSDSNAYGCAFHWNRSWCECYAGKVAWSRG